LPNRLKGNALDIGYLEAGKEVKQVKATNLAGVASLCKKKRVTTIFVGTSTSAH